MTITDPKFILAFAALVFIYYLIPSKIRWVLLLAASTAFYLTGGWTAMLYMLFTVVTTFTAGLILGRLDKKEKKAIRKLTVACAMILNFGLLVVIKYIPKSGLVLPMGLSFYMFQATGYVVDCYRKKYEPEKSFLRFFLFISFFPQVIQGPISRYDRLGKELKEQHCFNADEIKYGIQLMLWGYFKKLVVADRVIVFVNAIYNDYLSFTGSQYLLATICSCLQLYCDFSGGIDIVSGMAQCLDIHLPVNFRRPFFALNLTDYWQRWHISLSLWLKDYLFYPLAFSKPFIKIGEWSRKHFRGKVGKSIPVTMASFVVYFVIGIWHGAGYGYMAFGLFNAILITVSNLVPALLNTPKWFSLLRTWCLIVVSEFMIRAESLRAGMRMLSNVFTNFNIRQLSESAILSASELGIWDLRIICIGFAVILILEIFQEKGYAIRKTLEKKSVAIQWLCIFALLACVVFLGFCGEAVDANFIYGQF